MPRIKELFLFIIIHLIQMQTKEIAMIKFFEKHVKIRSFYLNLTRLYNYKPPNDSSLDLIGKICNENLFDKFYTNCFKRLIDTNYKWV